MRLGFFKPEVGKGEALATPSPLPRGGRFPPFTDVPVSGIGRAQSKYPVRGAVGFVSSRLSIKIIQARKSHT